MADYSIVFARSTRREIEKLHAPLSSRVLKRIESLDSNPQAGIIQVRPLEYNRELGQNVQVCERFPTTLLRLFDNASAIEKFTGRTT